MKTTAFISKVVGPVLLVRAFSILIDRQHFITMVEGLQREVATVSFSLFPIVLLMTCIALVVAHSDSSSVAAVLIRLMAWGGMLKASALMLFPGFVVAKAQVLAQAGFLTVVLVVCLAVGAYFTWYGYFASAAQEPEPVRDPDRPRRSG
jgi:hypothetical protein